MKKKTCLTIRQVSFGIACRIGNTIYVNKDLSKYPKLKKAIMKHEKEHSSGFDLRDLLIDLDNKQLTGLKKEYFSFIVKHPASLVEILPVWRYDGKFVVNPSILGLYVLTGGLIWLITSLF
jgi:hypothetical protein